MKEIAVALLELPNGKFVFQRRTHGAPTAGNRLGLFGGHLESGELPEDAVYRELHEETSLTFKKEDFHYLCEFITDDGRPARKFYLYKANIKTDKFQVYEGEGAESYSLEELLKREDAAINTKRSVELYMEK